MYDRSMTTDDEEPIAPEKVDFSPASVNEACQFVLSAIDTVIETLEAEKRWIVEMRGEGNPNLGMVVIALANQYRDAEGFQQRWSLREKK